MPLVVTPELLYNSISRSEYNCGMTSTMLKSDDHVITKVVLHACYSQIPPVISTDVPIILNTLPILICFLYYMTPRI